VKNAGDNESLPVGLAEQIADYLQSAGVCSASNVEKIGGGGMNEVFLVDGKLIVRLSDRKDGETFRRENQILRAIGGKIRAPKVILTDCSQSRMACDIMVLEKIEGKTLASSWHGLTERQKGSCIGQVCDELKKLHGLSQQGIPDSGETLSWAERFGMYVKGCLESASSDVQIDPRIVLFLKDYFLKNMRRLKEPIPQGLTHNDIHFGNILVSEGNLAALLDFEYAGICPIDYESAKIINFCRTPAQYVEEEIQSPYDRPMPEVLEMFRESYPEMFGNEALSVRQKLFLIPETLWGFKLAHKPRPGSTSGVSPEELKRGQKTAYDRFDFFYGDKST